MDCSWWYGNLGCSGGMMDRAFFYVINNGLETEEDYPYKEIDGKKCKQDKKKLILTIESFEDVEPS